MSSAQSLHATSIAQLEAHAREFGRVQAWLRAVADLAGETAVETLHMPQAKVGERMSISRLLANHVLELAPLTHSPARGRRADGECCTRLGGR